ncbi:hypothetical protein ACVWW1_008868 [Bradyrhizobium sp. JR3.5]
MRDCEGGIGDFLQFSLRLVGHVGKSQSAAYSGSPIAPAWSSCSGDRRSGHADGSRGRRFRIRDMVPRPKGGGRGPDGCLRPARSDAQEVVFEPCSAYAADIRDEIGRVPTDAVLGLDLLFGAAVGAQACGVPFAFLSPHVSIRILPGMPPATSGLGQPKTPQERAEVGAASAALAAAMNASLPILNRARVDFGLPVLSDAMDLFDQADRVLLAISQAFDFEADSLPGSFRYIGPLLDVPTWSRSWQAPWTAGPDCSPRADRLQHGCPGPARLVSTRHQCRRRHRYRSCFHNRSTSGHSRSSCSEERPSGVRRAPRLRYEGCFSCHIPGRPRDRHPFNHQCFAATHSANGTRPVGKRSAGRSKGSRASIGTDSF